MSTKMKNKTKLLVVFSVLIFFTVSGLKMYKTYERVKLTETLTAEEYGKHLKKEAETKKWWHII
jgi:hypothetical protein